MNIVETTGLGKRYGKAWALHDCTLTVPEGSLAALVGPNGAGKSTLINMAVGLTIPSEGTATVLGDQHIGSSAALDDIAFMAQDAPVYKSLSVADLLHLGRSLNRRFDGPFATARLADLGIPLKKKSGKLSGGQQAQVALTLALARRPRLLVLDEPLAALDPLARQDFMSMVMATMADDGMSVLLSSHALADLEQVADYLIVLGGGQLRIAGEVDDLLATHRVLTGPAAQADQCGSQLSVVQVRRAATQAHMLVRTATADDPVPPGWEAHPVSLQERATQAHMLVRTATADDPVPPGWEAHPVSLQELTLAYLRQPGGTALPGPASSKHIEPTEVA